ncbi:uracil/xanthine transporter [Bacillus lacus]|uniref:Uracil/xanthine transporter n=1 Tax=Metabacillus lacus TaxID=1983721 RepID=A0A7X2J2C2_9BACI|nr:uracil/xanthine transporter [Metabacillus lacus]MRX73827.1 uracil/xanthine transporter [Metabacillus lacus]
MKHKGYAVTVFSSIQWLFFIFANTIVVPVSIGAAFQLPLETVAMTIRISFIITGAACILQGLAGHRYPLLEGHSGLLWGLTLSLSLSSASLGLTLSEIGGGIAVGILLAGAVTVVLAACNTISVLQAIFTPMVMSVYLFLLTFQLIFIFFKGMFKLDSEGAIDLPVAALSIGLVIFVSLLKIKGGGMLGNFSILIGITAGWLLYVLIFPGETASPSGVGSTFTLFPLGVPNLQYGIIAVSFLAGLLNLTNSFASIQAAAVLYGEEAKTGQYRRSIFFTGLFSMAASLFGLVPYTPFASTIGFLQSTNILEKKPFFIGGALMTTLGLIPIFGSFLGTLPITVGNAVLFVAYLQLFGTALASIKGEIFDSVSIFRIAGPVLIGLCIMNVSPSLFSSLPVLLQPLAANGLIVGVLLSIFMEKSVRWEI